MTRYQLILNRIGKFTDSTLFELENETVFFGANEAGKTTVLDAMVIAQANFDRRQARGIYKTIIQSRYDDDVDVKLKRSVDNEEVAKLDHDLVNELLLVRASALSLNIEGASWIDEVRNNLFVGGVNPRTIIDTINEMENRPLKRNKSPLVEVRKLRSEIRNREQELQQINEELEEYADGLERQEKSRVEEQELKVKLGELDKDYQAASNRLSEEREKLKRVQIRAASSTLTRLEEAKEKVARASAYSLDRESKLKGLRKEQEDLKADQRALNQHVTTVRDDQKRVEERISAEQLTFRNLEEQKNEAERALNKLELLVSEQKTAEGKKPLVSIGIGSTFLVAGLILLFVADGGERYAALAGMAIGTIILIAAAVQKGTGKNSTLDLKVEARTFNQRCQPQEPCPDTDYATTTAYLRRCLDVYTQKKHDYDNLVQQREDLKVKLRDVENQQSLLVTKSNDLSAEIEEMLPVGVGSVDEYSEGLRSKTREQENCDKFEQELDELQYTVGVTSRDALVQHVEQHLAASRGYPADEKPPSQKELSELEEEVKRLQGDREFVSGKLAELATDLTKLSVETQIKVGDLSKKKIEKEKELVGLSSRKDESQLEMDSLLLLRDVVESIEGDTNEKFKALGKDLNKYLRVILTQDRNVVFRDLASLETTSATDYYGSEHEIGRLSSGTRDAFYLAARLAFLEKVQVNNDAFLLLDDPFVFMDRERLSLAMKAIRLFREEKNLPIALFTKDEFTKTEFLDVFPDAAIVQIDKVA